jgi:hypothetical protein
MIRHVSYLCVSLMTCTHHFYYRCIRAFCVRPFENGNDWRCGHKLRERDNEEISVFKFKLVITYTVDEFVGLIKCIHTNRRSSGDYAREVELIRRVRV